MIRTTLYWLGRTDRNWLLLFHNVTLETAKFLINEGHLAQNQLSKILFTTATRELAERLASATGTFHSSKALPVLENDGVADMLLDHLGPDFAVLDKAKEVIKYVSYVPVFIVAVICSTSQDLDNVLDLLRHGRRYQPVNILG